VDWLVRFEDEDFRWINVRQAPGGDLLVLYERGLLCIDHAGRMRWHVLHDNLSAGFAGVDNAEVTIRSEFPEMVGWVRRYSLATGDLAE